MAEISTGQSKITTALGSTWGTAVAPQKAAYGTLSLGTARGEFRPTDVGFDSFITEVVKLEQSVDVTFSSDLSYNGQWVQILASILGSESATTETTVGQGDYSHTLDIANTNTGKFLSLAYLYESDQLIELPSVKFSTFTITQNINGVGKFTAQGIADRVLSTPGGSPTTSVANITAATYQTGYQPCVFGGANHYLRLDNYSTSDALTNADDKDIVSFELMFTRPLQRDYALRGANTQYTLEPRALGDITGSLKVKFRRSAAASLDILNLWSAETRLMSEIFFDGAAIGTGANQSFKFQMPQLEAVGAFPTSFDLPNNNTFMQPEITFNMLKPAAAGAGMTGFTQYMRGVVISTRTTSYLA